MAAPKLLALHRDIQCIGCGCEGCKELLDSEYVGETRINFEKSLAEVPIFTDPLPVTLGPSDHQHIKGAVLRVEYQQGIPGAIHECAVCGATLPRGFI